MNIKDMYIQAKNIIPYGVDGYHVDPKYQNPQKPTYSKIKKY